MNKQEEIVERDGKQLWIMSDGRVSLKIGQSFFISVQGVGYLKFKELLKLDSEKWVKKLLEYYLEFSKTTTTKN